MVDEAPARDINFSDRETVETIMRKQASLINNKPTLNALRHVNTLLVNA